MKQVVTSAVALAALSLCSAPALAKAPKPADMPSVEEIYQQAMQAIAEKAKAAADKLRDPDREAIEGFRDRKAVLTDYQRLVDILNDAKTEKLQPYRMDAANALVARFQKEDETDPQVRQIRSDIARKLIDLMKADKKDEIGLRAIETILYNWWSSKMRMDIHFKASDKLEERKKAYGKMKKYLEKGD